MLCICSAYYYFYFGSSSAFCQPSPVGEGGSHRLTDEVSIMWYLFIPSAHILDPRPRHPYPAGVQTMRARICSAFSCDMFARVVWLKSCEVVKLPTFAPPFTARTCHAWLARLTRARGGSFLRGRNEPMHAVRWLASPRQGGKALLNDFCR